MFGRGAFAAIVVALALLCGCQPATPAVRTPDPVAGTYILRGGGGALAAVTALTSAFSAQHPGVKWQGFEDVGSDASIRLTSAGDADLGFISRELRPAEIGRVMTLSIGRTGTGFVVNAQNKVRSLLQPQLVKIFTGETADWKDVGGDPGPIRLALREPGSAVRSTVESYLFAGKTPMYGKNVTQVQSADESITVVGSSKDAIGMVSLSTQAYGSTTIRLLSLDGIAASRETIAAGTYPMLRPLYLIYNTDPAKIRPAITAFLEFVRGPDGQKVLAGL